MKELKNLLNNAPDGDSGQEQTGSNSRGGD
jgi:hypothetical protein